MNNLFRFFSTSLCLVLSNWVYTQTLIKGKVTDKSSIPLTGVNVFIKGTIEGTSTNDKGEFNMTTNLTGDTIIIFRHISMQELQLPIDIQRDLTELSVQMEVKATELEGVVITTGNFSVGDKNKATVMNTMDVETTAGADGDITGALRTLPGTQQVGESGQLFVRGGSGDETKITIDGLDIPNPFFSGIPDVAQRNRFSPHLFKGIVFNTGGYSAQYGGALSSVLALETKDHPSKPSTVIALIPYGVQVGHDFLSKKQDMSGDIDVGYSNFAPYYKVIPQKTDWLKAPESGTITANFRKNTSGNGMIKWYGYGNLLQQSINYPDVEQQGKPFPYEVKNASFISLLTYTRDFSDQWKMYAGYGFNFNRDDIVQQSIATRANSFQHQLRMSLTGRLNNWAKLHIGMEGFHFNTSTDSLQIEQFSKFRDNEIALWMETDLNINHNFIIRPGIRTEHSEAIGTSIFLPRLSMAYRINQHSQINLSVGKYAQKPNYFFIAENPELTYTKATHYIANFQYGSQKRIFRAEAYYKDYHKLLTTVPYAENKGNGYAGGIDLFWRDSKSLKGFDYWVSYTWLQTERKFMDYPVMARPTFGSPHTAHFVAKYFFEQIGLFAGSSYSVAAGRPYYNPNNPNFLGDKTPVYHNLNFNIALLRKWGNSFNTFVFAVNNLLGNEQIFNYRYATDGSFRAPISLPYKRSFMLGWFISIGKDRSGEILEQLP
ncbi:TonB-dependent receptor [Chryseobacterium sp. BIGb0232]|uniref:TonB-dependent receptor n=1 Tax=Chryseobacterium sp. BIGb0232 TaxID=2940598 RepID=UPI000F467624|nr:TonB-dependent receptor [Chryseobacterium sp. BIGb0232]MCS4301179.1 outer membrane cobalamin receptor [Chryseobacterium sp. BIGb0232]ROS19960.1 outer membrane cobalamin receptor [Chryseobacterium nakagawai]